MTIRERLEFNHAPLTVHSSDSHDARPRYIRIGYFANEMVNVRLIDRLISDFERDTYKSIGADIDIAWKMAVWVMNLGYGHLRRRDRV